MLNYKVDWFSSILNDKTWEETSLKTWGEPV